MISPSQRLHDQSNVQTSLLQVGGALVASAPAGRGSGPSYVLSYVNIEPMDLLSRLQCHSPPPHSCLNLLQDPLDNFHPFVLFLTLVSRFRSEDEVILRLMNMISSEKVLP